jgi:hypothetical protein
VNWGDERYAEEGRLVPPVDWDRAIERVSFWVIGIGFGYVAGIVVAHIWG